MIPQIVLLALMLLGFGLIVGKLDSSGGYHKEYSGGSMAFGLVITLLILWWGDFFEGGLNIWGFIYLGWHLFSWGVHISKNGQTSYLNAGFLRTLLSVGVELFLLYKSGFFDPLIAQ